MFQNQWRRLGGRFECSAPVVGDIHFPHPSVVAVAGFPYLAAQVNVHLDASIRSAISAYGGTGMHLLGLDGKVRFDGLTSHRYTLHSYCDPALTSATAGRHPASQEAVGFIAVSAWSLQTAQGAEVSVKLIIDTPPASSTIVAGANAVSVSTSGTASLFEAMSLDAVETSYRKHHSSADALEWTGRVVVRCSDHPTQQAVVCDMELFLYALSGGFISLSEPL